MVLIPVYLGGLLLLLFGSFSFSSLIMMLHVLGLHFLAFLCLKMIIGRDLFPLLLLIPKKVFGA